MTLEETVQTDPPASSATMRTMTEGELDTFVSRQNFGILALAEGGRAYGVPLFYGVRSGAIYFQTRAGKKTHYLYATAEACLTIAMTRGLGEWASVQLIGRLERVSGGTGSTAGNAIDNVPPPLPWDADDARGEESGDITVTTFRLVPTRRIGRYSHRAKETILEREAGYSGM